MELKGSQKLYFITLLFDKYGDKNETGDTSEMWKLKKKILNNDKKPLASAMIDHVNGKLMVTDQEIM